MTDATVKDICQAWAQAGYGDECFWEHWAECPTEETLTPNMLLACIETQAAEIERLRGDLAKAVEALQIARVHVANNAEGWSVSRAPSRDDLTIVDLVLAALTGDKT